MRDPFQEYEQKFGPLNGLWGLPLSESALDARLVKAIEEGTPVDFKAEYGFDPDNLSEVAIA